MSVNGLFDHAALAAQVHRQKKYAWDLENSIPWNIGIDLHKPFLPLDHDAIAFPGASSEQRLALSQLMGLIINSTIAEMENVINRLRVPGWEKVLRDYPVNPEMWELGDLFFIEENKHALAFQRYNELFCKTEGINNEELDLLIPKAFGSLFLKAVIANARAGGHSFWWIVASVEEVSLILYRHIHRSREAVDPLYYLVHRRHMEEEQRHHNYAFLMLDLIERQNTTMRSWLHKKTDLILAQLLSTGWLLNELHKVFRAEDLRRRHPFFSVIASCRPLFEKLTMKELASRLFISAPYVSLVLNTRNHPLTSEMRLRHGALSLPFPKPDPAATFTGGSGELFKNVS